MAEKRDRLEAMMLRHAQERMELEHSADAARRPELRGACRL